MSKGLEKRWVALGVLLLAVLVGVLPGCLGRKDNAASETRPPPTAPDTVSRDGTQGDTPAPARPPVTTSPPPENLLRPVPCALDALVEEYRQGKGSPAYRRYVGEQLRGILEKLPPEQLWAKVEAEQDPEVLEALSSLWVMRFNLTGDKGVLERLLDKTGRELDPARRAALVRSLRTSGEPSSEVLARHASKQGAYHAWVKDPAPEVREAVVGNLTNEAARGFGRIPGIAQQAVALASEAGDAKTAAGLLGASSLEAVGRPAVDSVRRMLKEAEHPEVRAAAAKALGTVAVTEAERTMRVLSERFATEPSREVRGAILEGIARLGLTKAVPVLQKLKGVGGELDGEIDLWLNLLASQPQTWELLLRDKQAQALAKNPGG